MDVGRELDALIAEKVMKLKPRGDLIARLVGFPRHYSTEIGAAWEVVEKLRGDGWDVQIDTYGYGDHMWRTHLGGDGGGVNVFGDGETAPHAICLVALEVMTEDDTDTTQDRGAKGID